MDTDDINSDQNTAANGDGGAAGQRLGRDDRGRFLPGHPLGGPGNPLAKQAVAMRNTWLAAGRKIVTPEIAERLVNELLRIAFQGTRDRDRVSAAATLIDKLGLSLQRGDGEPRGVGNFIIVANFTPKKPPDGVPPIIDQPPAN